MKYSAKAAAFAVIIGMPFATLAADKAPVTEGADLAVFQGIETMQVSDTELRQVFGERGSSTHRFGPRGGGPGGGSNGPRGGGPDGVPGGKGSGLGGKGSGPGGESGRPGRNGVGPGGKGAGPGGPGGGAGGRHGR
uniref:Uncharacterized protein n=1 Tax=Candidatus Kentrum sp. LFY TaxID=2126342 RepID=A0A450X200_9GAMM|nr:MAG: hypothetical protein BECKLFY1418C_GA0070996_11391 [Candidatus Kentron sp. LFY]